MAGCEERASGMSSSKDNDIHRIREKDTLRFLQDPPQEISLEKVDQTWFLDLVLLRGREVPEPKSSRGEVTST